MKLVALTILVAVIATVASFPSAQDDNGVDDCDREAILKDIKGVIEKLKPGNLTTWTNCSSI